jgi:outer membrane protein OmpA-like peptidoglycan-associated protein
MRRWWTVLCLVSAIHAAPIVARAEDKLIAVLPLDVSNTNGRMDKAARTSVEEMLRDVATDALANDGWTVMTGENTLQVLIDNGVDPTKCGEASCHLEAARELKASKFLSGAVQWVDSEFVASIRLIDSKNGRVIATARLEGPTTKALRKEFEAKSAAFFAKSGLLTSSKASAALPSPPPAPSPSPAPREEPTPAPRVALVPREAAAPRPGDQDEDGIPDAQDRCPMAAEDKDGFQDADGCPDDDNDGDGVPDAQDQCVNEAGPAISHGCPMATTRIEVKPNGIVLKEKLQFETGKPTIRPASFALLDEIAAAIANTRNSVFQVSCHTDAFGNDAANQTLSQKRADAVRSYLLNKGIPAHRVTAVGYGETMPIDTNATEEGRVRNRRVEITVVR